MGRLLLLLILIFRLPVFSEQVVVWHAFQGFLEEKFQEITDEFNTQSDHTVVLEKPSENYSAVFTEGIKAWKSGSPEAKKKPLLLQVYEVAVATMELNPEVYFPVGSLMRQYGKEFDPGAYIPSIRAFYSGPSQEMLGMPFNCSVGAVFYNKSIFKKAGLDPNSPPLTWPEWEAAFKKLKAAGFTGFTTAWPAAYHLEHMAAIHGLSLGTYKNGLADLKSKLIFNSPEIVKHWEKVVEWKKEGHFIYAGRFSLEPEELFRSQKCAMLMQGANRYGLIQRGADFDIGVAPLPYWPSVVKEPYSMNTGGGAFFALSGHPAKEYKAAAEFLAFLSSPKMVAKWHRLTGYLPVTKKGYELYLSQNKSVNPASPIATMQVLNRPSAPVGTGIRIPCYIPIRECVIDAFEQMIEGKKEPKGALDSAVDNGNAILEAFWETQNLSEKLPKSKL